MENNSSMVTLRSNINSYGNIEDFPPERFQRRVKVYYQSDRDWVVAGTGICTIEPVWENLPTIGDFMIRVLNEEKEGDIILSSRIRDLDCYQNQQETLLVWKDECPEIGSIEVCISFLDQIGRDEIWGCINFINKPPISPTLTESQPSSPHVDDTDYSAIADLIPQPDLNNLDTLETNLLSLIRGQNRKNSISSYFFQTQFIEQLVDVFKLCYDMEDDERMFRLCKITKYIFMLNEQSILEKCLSDALYLDIAGILEHDLESPNKELNYKEFLSKRERYRQVVPIGNQATLANIHFYYRLKYFKEVILNRTLDEAGFALMTFLLQNKNVEIINYVSRDSAYLTSLFNITKSEDVSKKRDLVAYLQNFCNQVKEIPPQMKTGIFKNSVNHGLFDIFQFSLNDTMDSVRKDSLEILLFIMDNDLELVRSNIMAKIKIGSVSLFQIIVKRFLVEEVTGIRLYLIEVIRALIDLNGFSGDRNMAFVNQMPPRTDPNFNELLDVFYEQFASDVFSPLIRLQASDFVKDSQNSKSLTSSQGTTLHYLCDLLTFNIKTHTLKSRQFIMDNNLLTKLIILFKSPKLPLQLAALRALKATLATKNPNYLNYFIRKDLIKSVFELYKSTNGANNMLNSACLDLFEFIRQQNFKQLISSIVTNYTPILENLEPKEVFSKLITVHQTNSEEAQSENKDSQDSTNERTQNPSTLQGRGWNSSTLNQNEEKYFEDSESDEEDAMDIDEEDSSNTSNQPPQLNGHQSINSQSSSQAEEPDVLENENNLNRLNRNITQIRSNGGSRIIPGQRQNRTLLKRTNNRIESSADLPTSDSKRRFVINLSPNTVNKISDNESASNGTNEKEEQSVKSPPQDPESMDLDQTQSISPNEPVSKTDSNSNNDAKLDTDSQSSDSLADDDLDNSRTEKEEDSPEQNQQSKSRSPSPIENQNSKNDSDSDTNTETISAPLSPPIVKNS